MEPILRAIKKLIPKPVFLFFQPYYHYLLALIGSLYYGFPSQKIFVIGVTGTKGKSSVIELVNIILEEAGFKTALVSTIRFKIGARSHPNLYKMTMPGRLFMQKFLHDAAKDKCDYAIIEMTSEGMKLFRHKFIDLDAVIFTNLSPEHIESHGSFENYARCKLRLVESLERSRKKERIVVSNSDDAYGKKFLEHSVERRIPYSLKDAQPYELTPSGAEITVNRIEICSPLLGRFNVYNVLAAIAFAESQGVDIQTIKRAIEKCDVIHGRVEKIDEGQNFTVIVDYAHTPDSLEKIYEAFSDKRKICVLGNAGGGRDRWKRPIMGSIADTHCEHIILTNEDPYDEDPRTIVEKMAENIKKHEPEIIMDRREAIRKALGRAKRDDVVLITGKGTDPYIMGPNNSKIPWSDANVVRKELQKLTKKNGMYYDKMR